MSQPVKGVVCPQCNEPSQVRDSRPTVGALRRRRKCSNGHTFSTLETIVPDIEKGTHTVKGVVNVRNADLPLTYLSIEEKTTARRLFAAKWSIHEVAKFLNYTVADLRK